MITQKNIKDYVGRKIVLTRNISSFLIIGMETIIVDIHEHAPHILILSDYGHNGHNNTFLNTEQEIIKRFGSNKCWYVEQESIKLVDMLDKKTNWIQGEELLDWVYMHPEYHTLTDVQKYIDRSITYKKNTTFIHMHNGKKFVAFNVICEDGEEIPLAFLKIGFKDNTNLEKKTISNAEPTVSMASHVNTDVVIKSEIQEAIIITPQKRRRLITAD